jgi:hypothetical protein
VDIGAIGLTLISTLLSLGAIIPQLGRERESRRSPGSSISAMSGNGPPEIFRSLYAKDDLPTTTWQSKP